MDGDLSRGGQGERPARLKVKLGPMPGAGHAAFLEPSLREPRVGVGAQIIDDMDGAVIENGDGECEWAFSGFDTVELAGGECRERP